MNLISWIVTRTLIMCQIIEAGKGFQENSGHHMVILGIVYVFAIP